MAIAAASPLITSATIQELSPGLFAFAYRAVRQREEAEDLVQDTWISALRTAGSFEGRSSLRTWLVSILRRRIADRFRRSRPAESFEEDKLAAADGSTPAEERLGDYEAATIAAKAMDELTELERTAVTLCDVQDFDRDEARAHGCHPWPPAGAVAPRSPQARGRPRGRGAGSRAEAQRLSLVTSSTCECTPSLRKMDFRWLRTVWRLM
jgi:RNA polymerase sigma factor (sigma-70 family)